MISCVEMTTLKSFSNALHNGMNRNEDDGCLCVTERQLLLVGSLSGEILSQIRDSQPIVVFSIFIK